VPGSVVKVVFHQLTSLLYAPQSAIQVELLAPEPAPEQSETSRLELDFKYSHFILPIASKYGVDWKLVASVMSVESNFNPHARSRKGALGLMQLMPRTAALYQLRPEDMLNPQKNIEAGVRHLSMLHKRFDGNLELTIAAYNCGEGAIDRFDGVPPYKHTRSFVRKVLARYKSPGTFLKGSRVTL
jgi:soluble lytic murein transglycosylase-like protein